MSRIASILRRAAGALLLLSVALVAAALVTGLARSVVTDGVSMLPTHHTGDLVVVARTGAYEVGQVVAYRDAESDRIVLHRIVGGGPDAFDLKGDNNASIDPTHPSADDLLGVQVLHVPRVGVAFRTPVGVAVLLGAVAVLGTVLLGGGRRRDPRRTAPVPTPPAPPRSPWVTVARTGLVAMDLAVAGVLVATFVVRPHEVPAPPVPHQTGTIGFETLVPVSEVYPDGVVRTGDPVFLSLVDHLDVVFRYRTDAPADVRASGTMSAEVVDGSGWSRTFDVAARSAVLDGRLELRGSLDLGGIGALVRRVSESTGMPTGPMRLTVTASVAVETSAGERSFEVQLPLEINQLVARTGGDAAPVDSDGDGVPDLSVTSTLDGAPPPEPTTAGGLPDWVRKVALAGLVLAIVVTVVVWPASRPGDDEEQTPEPAEPADVDEPVAAAAVHPRVAVRRLVLPLDALVVEVADPGSLDDIARANQVPVFETDDGDLTVVTGVAVHRWRSPATTPTLELPQVRSRLFAARPPHRSSDADPAAEPDLVDDLVRHLGDPVLHHLAMANRPASAPDA